jgi:hypothetical protein
MPIGFPPNSICIHKIYAALIFKTNATFAPAVVLFVFLVFLIFLVFLVLLPFFLGGVFCIFFALAFFISALPFHGFPHLSLILQSLGVNSLGSEPFRQLGVALVWRFLLV